MKVKKPPHLVEIKRPLKREDGNYEVRHLKRFPVPTHVPHALTVVEGVHPLHYTDPPKIDLDTTDKLEILRLLEYAGIYYMSPDSHAASQGVELFNDARNFAIESAPEWVGFDWDFTTNIYKIYGPLLPLITIKLLHMPPLWIQSKRIKLFEAAKPGMHEVIFGMAVGYALRQGLRSFDQWEYYQPQVRWVTQTWPNRLAQLGTGAIRLIPLVMGKYPGGEISENDIRGSNAFVTLEDFLNQIKRLLRRFIEGGLRFHHMSPREQDEVMEIIRVRKGFRLKPISTFAAKGWLPPDLVFDDSPSSNARLKAEGIRVVSVLNPIVPGKEMSDIKALSILGRNSALKTMIRVTSKTEGPAIRAALNKLRNGEKHILLEPKHLVPVPQGTILELHDISATIAEMLSKFKKPQGQINELIERAVRLGGGLNKIEAAYKKAASLRKTIKRL